MTATQEEAHLFRLMKTKKGFSGGCSPVVVMTREHELGRLYIAGMESHAERAATGDPDELRWFIENARSYAKLIREHIKKEDYCLFPAADRALSDQEKSDLLVAFAKIDGEGTGMKELAAVRSRIEPAPTAQNLH